MCNGNRGGNLRLVSQCLLVKCFHQSGAWKAPGAPKFHRWQFAISSFFFNGGWLAIEDFCHFVFVENIVHLLSLISFFHASTTITPHPESSAASPGCTESGNPNVHCTYMTIRTLFVSKSKAISWFILDSSSLHPTRCPALRVCSARVQSRVRQRCPWQ